MPRPRPDATATSSSATGTPTLRATGDGSLTLFDPATGESYHSDRGAWSETLHVFLGASGVADRLADGRTTHVVEVGLGTGTNLLATLDAAIAGDAKLHYRALELRPPPVDAVRALDLGRRLARPELEAAWLDVLTELHAAADRDARRAGAPHRGGTDAPHAFAFPGGATLEVALDDAATDDGPSPLAAAALEAGWAHAVFHDAFSPGTSPELWTDAFLGACARALAPGGAWVSYTVAGVVRRSLAGHGLRVEKLPGPPGGKREMARAVRPRAPASGPTGSPTR